MSARTTTAAPARRVTPDEWIVWGVVALAWALALAGGLAGRSDWLAHDALLGRGVPDAATLLRFLLAWQVMVGAMMLPTALPMVRLFARASRGAPGHGLAMLAFLGAYAAVWTAFALAAVVGDAGVHALAATLDLRQTRPGLLAGLALLLAGAFQFSPLKEQCLRACRHPVSFLMHYYGRGVRAAWRLGLRHGLFCLGCCWALMLVMFAVGAGSLVWMSLLTGVMLIEKTSRWGRRLVPVVGLLLLLWGGLLLVGPGWLPAALRGT